MEMTSKYFIFIITILFFINCGSEIVQIEEDLTPKFNKAMKFFGKGKYLRARDEFNNIIVTNPGSKLANESQYYKGESLFQMKEYDDAWITFDRYIRFTNDAAKIEKSRYRICECAIYLTNSHQRDQKQTKKALEQLQMYLEDFPQSERVIDAEKAIAELRIKLAEKDFEVGRLYLKLEEYESALIYFRSVLNNYYDTDFADDARIGIIFTHILNENWQGARSYLHAEKTKFLKQEKYSKAESLLDDTKTGLNLSHYYQLYR
jgi:outer membrane protein assembly factor BamD